MTMAVEELREAILENCLTVLQAARRLDCSEGQVARLIHDGSLELVFGGGKGNLRLLSKASVERLAAEREARG